MNFKNYQDNYILLYVDLTRKKDLLSDKQLIQNKKLLTKLNKRKVFPLSKVLDSKG